MYNVLYVMCLVLCIRYYVLLSLPTFSNGSGRPALSTYACAAKSPRGNAGNRSLSVFFVGFRLRAGTNEMKVTGTLSLMQYT